MARLTLIPSKLTARPQGSGWRVVPIHVPVLPVLNHVDDIQIVDVEEPILTTTPWYFKIETARVLDITNEEWWFIEVETEFMHTARLVGFLVRARHVQPVDEG